MATGNRSGERSRSSKNNNPSGRNQYSGLRGTARQNPIAAAAAVGGAVAAGVFLWSRRNQISDQIDSLSEQISDWREGMAPDAAAGRQDNGSTTSGSLASGRSQTEIAEEALSLKETGRPA